MSTESKILTLHPDGKTGRNITQQKYDTIKEAILISLRGKELTHNELFDAINKRLVGAFDGNINWYGETVKLDLEARKTIERNTAKPAKYRIV